ncbi:folylpolyglutamate synthase, mitochondrial-like isoform X2 [Mya arenaria]|uniref:folylpolyglutamate synthase, mitochondrial-like isoform X2 n=1 Tax=Mya arenaria TaxID=6604 RepID=UPI0022E2D46D|nr:folylpolyglutamate synthase, mitochondrial-like isoform X2 [Mya arenaria]
MLINISIKPRIMVRTIVSSAVIGERQNYEEAVKTLNTLQSNAQTIQKMRLERDKNAPLNIPKMLNFASRVGIQEADIDRLNVIHVSGTKGKGSTCAYCESILRHHGYKTGFFSSPHLIEVRERLEVGGMPIEQEKFATYFWDVYNKLDTSKEANDGIMPNYFGFLTLMSLYVFLKESVDVAIMEVGIGGEYDCTNLVRKPFVCGVTSLGLDHVSILGHTLDKIAWHKAGIFKPGVPAFTVPQPPEAMKVLAERAEEKKVPLYQCPDVSVYKRPLKLGIKGSVQAQNAALALQLCNTWIHQYAVKQGKATPEHSGTNTSHSVTSPDFDVPTAPPIDLSQQYVKGLEDCVWKGRNQTMKVSGVTFYIDGAHTTESIQQCVDWFSEEAASEKSNSRDDVYRVLIYNCTGDRETSTLMRPLVSCGFDAALFCPNIAYETAMSADQTNNTVTKESQMRRCSENKDSFNQMWQQRYLTLQNNQTSNVRSVQDLSSHTLPSISECINWVCKRKWQQKSSRGNPYVSSLYANEDYQNDVDIENSFNWVAVQHGTHFDMNTTNGHQPLSTSNRVNQSNVVDGQESKRSEKKHVQVLITGSLHLVGGALRVLNDRQS